MQSADDCGDRGGVARVRGERMTVNKDKSVRTEMSKISLTNHKLGELCNISSAKRIFENEYVSSGIPFIRGLEISNGSILKDDAVFDCYISKER